MPQDEWTVSGEAVTELIMDVFRLNGRLLVAGDRLVANLGLTSARWQILGSIAYAEQSQTVAWHARSMGVHRQGVQRIVNELEKEDLLEFQPNPNHKRAHLVAMTAKGQKLFDDALCLQKPWVNFLSSDLKLEDIETTRKVIKTLKARLEVETKDAP